MPLFIGGCGSTGSSLLRQILNRHPNIYISNESHLFCKSALYEDWNKNKSKFFARSVFGLRSSGYKMYTGIDLAQDFTKASLRRAWQMADDFSVFSNVIYGEVDKVGSQVLWGDKTPANIFHFEDIKKAFPEATMIHTRRRPEDTLASLVRRGMSVYHAVCRFLLSVNAAERAASRQVSFYELDYEALLSRPQKELASICTFIGVPYDEVVLHPSKAPDYERTKIAGWSFDESDAIEVKTNPSFEKLTDGQKSEIRYAITHLRLTNTFLNENEYPYPNILAYMEARKYSVPEGVSNKGSLEKQALIDLWQRTLRMYPFHFFDHPFYFYERAGS